MNCLEFFLKNRYFINTAIYGDEYEITFSRENENRYIAVSSEPQYEYSKNKGIYLSCYASIPNEEDYAREINVDELRALVDFFSLLERKQDSISLVSKLISDTGVMNNYHILISETNICIKWYPTSTEENQCNIDRKGKLAGNGADRLSKVMPQIANIIWDNLCE